jgi:glutathione-independent formaldehyde dehydrogenase
MHEHHCTGSQLPGPAVVIVGDMIKERLDQARSFGCATIDLTRRGELPDMIKQIVGEPVVDAAVDCVGFEARGHGTGANEAPATVLNSAMTVTRAAGRVGIPDLYVTGDPGSIDEDAKFVSLVSALVWVGSSSSPSPQDSVLLCATIAS